MYNRERGAAKLLFLISNQLVYSCARRAEESINKLLKMQLVESTTVIEGCRQCLLQCASVYAKVGLTAILLDHTS